MCRLIFALRRFLILPMSDTFFGEVFKVDAEKSRHIAVRQMFSLCPTENRWFYSVNYLVERILDDAFRAQFLEVGDDFADDLLVHNRLDRDPTGLGEL